ncbi:MAG: N-acetylmuramoyl-L-alanine amidase [Saccharofermentans sp.]|nr:N-acetylmuramoyl-L-alanine amidase [Saccharofermentans sp.]
MNKTAFKKFISIFTAAMVLLTLLPGFVTLREAEDAVPYSFTGMAHIQDQGDTEGVWDTSSGILTLGTTGMSRRLEAIKLSFTNNTGFEGSMQYQVHIQNIGWTDWIDSGSQAGTSGRSLRLEGIRIRLTGELAKHYSVEYHVHIQDYGDSQPWVNDGTLAGTTGESKRLEQLKVKLVSLDDNKDTSMSIMYHVHRQDYGWETDFKTDGTVSGTTGQAKRLEAINISLLGNQYSGSIKYSTHVQDYGWMDEVTDGELSGTVGESKRLEGIRISLTGEVAEHYDVYYRTHIKNFGWLSWVSNGADSGSSGIRSRLEAIQIVLVAKNSGDPGDVKGIQSANDKGFLTQADVPLPGYGYRICLDAGHHELINRSPVNKAYWESVFNWDFHLKLKASLEEYGFEVITTRSSSIPNPLPYDRGRKAVGCDLYISIHTNSSDNRRVNNPEAYCAINGWSDAIGQRLCNTISDTMNVQRGRVIHWNERVNGSLEDHFKNNVGAASVGCPSMLLEVSYHSNLYATNWMLSSANQQKLADAMAATIAQYFEECGSPRP